MDYIIYTVNKIVKEYKIIKPTGSTVLYTVLTLFNKLYHNIRPFIIHSYTNIPQTRMKLIEYHSDAIALDAVDKFDNFTIDNYKKKESMTSKRHSARIDYWTPVRKDAL